MNPALPDVPLLQHWPPEPEMLFWIALTMVGAALLGELVWRWQRLPRLVGYSAAGMVIAMASSASDHWQLRGDTRLVVDLGLALLLFELGSRVHLHWLRRNPALLWTSALETGVSFAAIAAVLVWLGWATDLALAGATLTVSASGAVIGRVAQELKSAGQVTERMVVLSALNTLYAVLVFKLITAWFDLDLRGDWVGSIAQPLFTFGGSWLLAWGLYRLIAWSLRTFDLQDENTVLLLLGLLLLGLTAARMLGLSTLLVPLLAGVLLRNATPRPCIWPRHFGTAGGALVLLLFVVLGGVWSPSALVAGGGAALAVLAVRTLAKAGTLVLTARWSGIELRQALALALTLTPVSATTLVLLADLHAVHPEVAARLAPMVLSAIAIMAVLGPLAAAGGLRLAGEHQRPDAPARARPTKESP